MSQTLLIHDNSSFIDIVKLNLAVYVGTDVIIKKNFKESKILMEHHPGIDLIICADVIEGEPTAELTFKFYQEMKKRMPLIVTGNKAKLPKANDLVVLATNSELPTFLQTAADFLKITPKMMVDKIVPEFFPLSAYYCLNIDYAPCDIYLGDENGYTLRYAQDARIETGKFYELMQTGLSVVYVPSKDRLKFVNHVTLTLNLILQDDKSDPRIKIGIADKSLQIMQEEALQGGSIFDMTVKVLAISAIKTCMEISKQNPKIASLLKELLSNKSSFRYKHVQVCIYICSYIVSNLEWGSNELKEKLAFVTFFHDIFLTEDRLAKINASNYAEMENRLSPKDIETVLKHAKQAAEIVQKIPVAPIGSDVIIMQHHGMIRGQGFPETFSNDLSPLTIIFIVAEEFTHMILENESNEEIPQMKEEMIGKLYEKFPGSKYVKIIDILKSISF